MQKPFYPAAIACVYGGTDVPELRGKVKFFELAGSVLIEAEIKNLPENNSGFFGFHIHEGSDCSGTDFADTGSHFNPRDTVHPSHAGDMPPLLFCNGGAHLSFKTDRFKIKDIIGKTVVIHDRPDDFTTQPAGNAGKKIACGVIKNNSHL